MTSTPAAPIPRPGPRNSLTDVPGLSVGHAADDAARTGVTVVLAPSLVTAAVDVRGGGPATRETDALATDTLVGGAHAIVLSGGSVFGLAAADGVATALSEQGRGLAVSPGAPTVPLVPAACIYDLPLRPATRATARSVDYRALGITAAEAARTGDVALGGLIGAVGVGTGAMAGAAKGGVGTASIDLGDGLIVAALVAANPVGSVYAPNSRCFWAWPFEIDAEFGGRGAPAETPSVVEPIPPDAKIGRERPPISFNTTIGVVATTADLSRPDAKRLAMMAQDGLARAIRPAHTPFDGDTLFALATGTARRAVDISRGDSAMRLARLGSAAADCVARAIARGVWSAESEADGDAARPNVGPIG